MSLKESVMNDHFQEITGGLKMLECMTVYAANKNYSFQIINMRVKAVTLLFGTISSMQ
jgi:hypothetical protein